MSKFEFLPKLKNKTKNKASKPFLVYTVFIHKNIYLKGMMPYRKQYIPFKSSLQLLKAIKFMPDISADSHQTHSGYPNIRFFFRISW